MKLEVCAWQRDTTDKSYSMCFVFPGMLLPYPPASEAGLGLSNWKAVQAFEYQVLPQGTMKS